MNRRRFVGGVAATIAVADDAHAKLFRGGGVAFAPSLLFGYSWGNRTTHIDEVKSYTNLYTVVPESLTENINPILATLSAAGLGVIFAVGPIVADPTTGLRLTDWSARLDEWNAAQGATVDGRIVAIYLPDEPYHLGWTGPELEQVAARIKVLWPNHKQALIEAYQKVRELGTETYPIPVSVDYVGFDRYGTEFPNTDTEYNIDYNTLLSRLTATQQMIVVGESQWSDFYESVPGLTPEVMGPMFDDYYNVAKRPKVAMFILYLYPNGFESPTHIGAEGLPQSVIDRHIAVGRAVTGK